MQDTLVPWPLRRRNNENTRFLPQQISEYSPDGKLLASWSDDDAHVRVWVTRTCQLVSTFPTSEVDRIALSPALINHFLADRFIALRFTWQCNASLWCLYWPPIRSIFGFSTRIQEQRWHNVPLILVWGWPSISRSWAFHWWVWAYAARNDGWVGDGSRRWATDLGPRWAQEIFVCATAPSGDRCVPNLNNPGLVWLKIRQKVDGMHWQRVVERTGEKGEGGRKSVGVRNQGARVLSWSTQGVQMNRWIGEKEDLGRAHRSTKFSLRSKDTHYSLYLRLPSLYL